MPERILLKLGGSVITRKGEEGTGSIRNDVIIGAARVLKEYSDSPLLLVHGAGSYGHPQAERYNIQSGVTIENREGIFETHQAVSFLNDKVMRILRSEGIEAISVHPLLGAVATDGILSEYLTVHLELMMGLGIVPVLHGDVVMDRNRGACIISGDQLIRILAEHLHMNRVGLVTDVSGLLDANGSVVRELRRSMAYTIPMGGSGHTDVTGGMKGKIEELLILADKGISSEIFHISGLKAFLQGEDHGGTYILPEVV